MNVGPKAVTAIRSLRIESGLHVPALIRTESAPLDASLAPRSQEPSRAQSPQHSTVGAEDGSVTFWDDAGGETLDPAQLDAFLETWRGFGGKGSLGKRDVALLGTTPVAVPGTPRGALQLATVRVTYRDGRSELYQVPVHVQSGRLNLAGASEHAGAFYQSLADAMVEGRALPGEQIHGALTPAGEDAVRQGLAAPHPYRTIPADSSNTLAENGAEVLKLASRLQPGMPNRELDHSNFHRANGIFHDLTQVHGVLTTVVEGKPTVTGLLLKREDIETDAWLHFQSAAKAYSSAGPAEKKTLLASLTADAHAIGVASGLMAKSYRLGTEGATSMLSRPMQPADVDGLLARTTERVDRLMDVARTSDKVLPPIKARILALEPTLRARIEAQRALLKAAVTENPGRYTLQSGHFDYHLGQVVKTRDGRWVVMDFEGEPAASPEDAARLSVAEKDAGGMLRSFSYNDAEHQTDLAPHLAKAFLQGHNSELPLDPALLEWMTGEKAIYEVPYEAQNRPAWLDIPLAPVERFANGG